MKKLLLIEDDPDILSVLELLLADHYEVHTAMTAAIVPEVVTIKPDLILLDNWLPGMTGEEISKILKAQPTTSMIPVIMVSASNISDDAVVDSGVDAFIMKPFDINELIVTIEKLINSDVHVEGKYGSLFSNTKTII